MERATVAHERAPATRCDHGRPGWNPGMAIPAPVEPEPEPIEAMPPPVEPELPGRPLEPIDRGPRGPEARAANRDEDSRALLSRNA
jgi:hypothetical protein